MEIAERAAGDVTILDVTGKMTLRQWVATGAGLGVDGLEFYSGFLDLQAITHALEARRLVEDFGLSVPMFCCSPDFTHPDPAFRQGQVDAEADEVGERLEEQVRVDQPPPGLRRPVVGDAEDQRPAGGLDERQPPQVAQGARARRGRRVGGSAIGLDIVSTFRKMSTKPDQVQTPSPWICALWTRTVT